MYCEMICFCHFCSRVFCWTFAFELHKSFELYIDLLYNIWAVYRRFEIHTKISALIWTRSLEKSYCICSFDFISLQVILQLGITSQNIQCSDIILKEHVFLAVRKVFAYLECRNCVRNRGDKRMCNMLYSLMYILCQHKCHLLYWSSHVAGRREGVSRVC